MKTIIDQILASTTPDLQGEQLSKEDLKVLLDTFPDPFTLNDHHDMSKGCVGIARNMRIEQDSQDTNTFYLKADVEITDERYEEIFKKGGGMSWSLTVPIRTNYPDPEYPKLMIFLPWPYYNESNLIDTLLHHSQNTLVGKVIKKGADSVSTTIIVSAVSIFLGAAFSRFFDDEIAPALKNSMEQMKVLWDKRLHTVHVFPTHYGYNLECLIYLNPDPTQLEESCSVLNIKKGINSAISIIQQRIEDGKEPLKCSMKYYSNEELWKPVSVQYRGGTYENFD